MEKLLFWVSFAGLVYAYVGYPLIMAVLARLRPRAIVRKQITPKVSIVLACHNESGRVGARITNLLELEYAADLLEVIVVSDGSTDETATVARQFASPRVRIIELDRRVGKAAAVNFAAERAAGEVLVFADARQWFEADVVKNLVANFADPAVGAVSGELLLDGRHDSTIAEGVGLYWKYEKWIRKNESRFDSTIGTTGSIYAVRRCLWKPLPCGTILDDLYTPMLIAMEGHRVVFEPRARAHDDPAATASREFLRKVRTLSGNYQLCQLMPQLLGLGNRLFFQFCSHKLARLVAPLFLIALFGTSIFLSIADESPSIYRATLVLQTAFFLGVLGGALLARHRINVRLLNAAYMFWVMNAAALAGLFYFLSGKRDIWVRSE